MKKIPGRVRHVRYEGACYISASDLVEMFSEINDNKTIRIIEKYLGGVMLDNANIVPGMDGEKKQEWQDIMKPN